MNLFTIVGTGLKTLFGGGAKGSDNIMTVAKGVGGWIDEQKFTDEEKATFNAAMVDKFSDFMQNTVDENTERSRSRREIALWVIRFEVILLGFSVLAFKLDQAWSEYAFKIATSEPLSYLVLGVGAFFFGAHIVRTYQGKK